MWNMKEKLEKKTNLTTFELSFDVQRNPDGGQIQVRQNILIQNWIVIISLPLTNLTRGFINLWSMIYSICICKVSCGTAFFHKKSYFLPLRLLYYKKDVLGLVVGLCNY